MGSRIMYKGCFYQIAVGNKYWIGLSTRGCFFSKLTGEMIWTIKIRFASRINFLNDSCVIIKTTEGKYYRCNIDSRECDRIYTDKRITCAGQDHCPIIDAEHGVLYDIINKSLYEQYVIKLDLQNGVFSFSQIPYSGQAFNWSAYQNGFSFIFNKTRVGFEEVLITYAENSFAETSLHFKNSNTTNVLYYDTELVLYTKGVLMLHGSKQEYKLKLQPDILIKVRSCSVIGGTSFILLVYRKLIQVFDIKQEKIVYSYGYEDIYDARVIDKDLYLATANHLLKIDDVFSRFTV